MTLPSTVPVNSLSALASSRVFTFALIFFMFVPPTVVVATPCRRGYGVALGADAAAVITMVDRPGREGYHDCGSEAVTQWSECSTGSVASRSSPVGRSLGAFLWRE